MFLKLITKKTAISISIGAIAMGLSISAQAGESSNQPLRNLAGQLSPLQVLSCGSETVNIRIEARGDETDITLNDILRVYKCEGGINFSGAVLKCKTDADDAPKNFELHTGKSGNGTFSFSGSNESSALNCSIPGRG